MSDFRARGQETRLQVTRESVGLLTEITLVKNFVFGIDIRILEEQYLGMKSNKLDEIFDSVSGDFTAEVTGTQILLLQQMVYTRARERTATPEKVTATFRVNLPGGGRPRITIPELFFGPIKINAEGRDRYLNVPFSYKAESYILSV